MAQFQILFAASETEWRPVTIEFAFAPHDDQQYLWPSFEDAETARQRLLARAPDARFRIALAGSGVGDLEWRIREKLRFADGSYVPTPWHDEPWYQARHNEHFCHISSEQAGKIAFTENAAKGANDRQLVMSPGRYLHRFFSEHLDNEAIEGWCARLSVLLQEDILKVTQDPDEIEDVYVGGPSSCMAHDAGDFESPCHPARVYAGPDTALAYLGDRGDATARSIVWPARLIYTSLYGDVSRLRLILEAAGYTEGSLDGARIRRIPHGDEFVVPYIDRGGNLADDGAHLIIGQGDISCDSTSGLADIPWYCPHCSDQASPHEEVFLLTGESEEWCYDCFRNDTAYCEHNDRHYSVEETFVTVYVDGSSHMVLEQDAEAYGAVFLEGRDEWWDRTYCGQCAGSGDWFHLDDLTHYQGEWLSEAHLPEPFDDDDPLLANAHVRARRRFLSDLAALTAGFARRQTADDEACAGRQRRGRDETHALQPSAYLGARPPEIAPRALRLSTGDHDEHSPAIPAPAPEFASSSHAGA